MNNRMILIILTAFFLFGFSSCNTSYNDNQQNQKAFRSILNNNQNDSLIVIQNMSENYMMVLTKHNDDVISICGGGNIDFCYTNNDAIIIDSAIFDETGESYVLPLYVKGSTYGAVEYYVIYREYCESPFWYVYKIPFSNMVINDTNGDGFSELITYRDSDSSIFSFKKGCLHEW